MKNVKHAWKVLVKYDEKWQSGAGSSSISPGHRSKFYNMDCWNYPPRYGNKALFVFKTRADARDFCRKYTARKIFKVAVKNTSDSFYNIHSNIIYANAFPVGTMFCRSLKIIKKSS